MPLREIIEAPHSRVGLWEIRESTETLLGIVKLSDEEKAKYETMTSEKRRLQWLAVRALLPLLNSSLSRPIGYDPLGKPAIDSPGDQISISHSGKLVAIQISADHFCGVDIQEYSNKMERLASKFINEDEWAFIPKPQSLDYLNLIWTMKEAVFKHFGSNLEFKRQIFVQPFDIALDNEAVAVVKKGTENIKIGLAWRRIGEYFLTYLC